jgi:hypothetical protein
LDSPSSPDGQIVRELERDDAALAMGRRCQGKAGVILSVFE